MEVINAHELSRAALVCGVKYVPACRVRGFLCLHLVSLKILHNFMCKHLVNVAYSSACIPEREFIMNLPEIVFCKCVGFSL